MRTLPPWRCDMNIQIVAFVFGGLLLFIGVLGGGFEVKELKIPKVGVGVRVVSVVVGVVFICLGFGGAMQGNSQAAQTATMELLWRVHRRLPLRVRPSISP